MKLGHWRSYFTNLQKKRALILEQDDIKVEYGEVIYTTPEVEKRRWTVTNYKGEYNVFVDMVEGSKLITRDWGANFSWKDRAVSFAIRMALVCSGKITRKDRHAV